MKTRYILRKQLALLPSRFVIGCIGPSRELSPRISPMLLRATESKLGRIEHVSPVRDFPNAPQSYFAEMGLQPLSTIVIALEQSGAYTDLHHLKNAAMSLEREFQHSDRGRRFNLNPGAVGRYGLCLASHKPTGSRPDISTYAFGLRPHLVDFSESTTYYERVLRWSGARLIPLGKAGQFPEYKIPERIERFEELVRSIGGTLDSVELLADKAHVSLRDLASCFL